MMMTFMTKVDDDNALNAIHMGQYNIRMSVLTGHNKMIDMIEMFQKMPISQVRSIHKRSLENARKADKFYEQNPHKARPGAKRWQDFCDDCVIAHLSGHVAYNKPVMMIHPDVYADASKIDSRFNQCMPTEKPTLLSGVDVCKLDKDYKVVEKLFVTE